jgi:predicted helicase
MSIQRINQYYRELANIQYSTGTKKESSIRRPFANLLSYYGELKKLNFVDEVKLKNLRKVPDGALVGKAEVIYGYWEAKDLQDDLEKEIVNKINIGYPTFNIIFENSKDAVLIQDDKRVYCDMTDARQLHALLQLFIGYEPPEAKNYKDALAKFAARVPEIAQKLLKMIQSFTKGQQASIEAGEVYNKDFVEKHEQFFEICKTCINPYITKGDINEMIVQHILTEEIFMAVFSDNQFHEENNIAQALIAIEKTFFTGDLKRDTLGLIKDYTQVIKAQASQLQSHREKQNFLKTLYEDFYQAYNPKGADKLGIVYTPLEIVRFIIQNTDSLLEKHFDRTMADKNVHILDPATGTGSFITDLIDYLPHLNLAYKYKNEIHANELSILPYYIAYLNVEYTYYEKMNQYLTYDNLCWVDTLDNIDAFVYKSKQVSMVGNVTSENYVRIQAQNSRKISVIMGNPPYNANQQNENDNNKNREYFRLDNKRGVGVDDRIKDTYIKQSSATKTKQYDMYKRFFRWASDRMNEDGIISFITNRAFINSAQDDGFRKCVKEEFNEVHIVDLQGDVRANDSRQGENVFNIMTGVAITFLIKNKDREGCKIYYYNIGDSLSRQEKLQILQDNALKDLPRETIHPDKKHNWINLSVSDFATLMPLVADADSNEGEVVEEKSKNTLKKEQIFEFSGVGVNTARDEWVFDFNKDNLYKKVAFFADTYNTIQKKHLKSNADKLMEAWEKAGKKGHKPKVVDEPTEWDTNIKWSETLKRHFLSNKEIIPDKPKIILANYRPFTKQWYYTDQILSDRLTNKHYAIFGEKLDKENKVICFTSPNSQKEFMVLAVNSIMDLHFTSPATNAFVLPFYTYVYDKKGNCTRQDNITDWALGVFQKRYATSVKTLHATSVQGQKIQITKEDIFHYIYAVLHSPTYREKYALDLKREFPRIPLYDDFWHYAEAGKELMALHIGYESLNLPTVNSTVKVHSLPIEAVLPKRKNTGTDIFGEKEGEQENRELAKKYTPEVKLKSPQAPEGEKTRTIEIDSLTTISGVPLLAYQYKLGNQSAIEWVLDQYKPYKSSDETIQQNFNTYRFSDYKQEVIDLLLRVIYVSVRTMEVVEGLKG